MSLSPSVAAMTRDPEVYYLELSKLGTIEVPFGQAYLWIVCEPAGGYFSKTDYLNRATYFESQRTAREFLEVFPFIHGTITAGQAPAGRSLANSFDRHVLYHLFRHDVFIHFPQGVRTWKTQLSGPLQARLSALAPL